MRADALSSVLINYYVLQELWVEVVTIVSDTETLGRLNGVAAVMERFDFLFGVMLGEMLLKHSDNLSKTPKKTICSKGTRVCSSHSKNIRVTKITRNV